MTAGLEENFRSLDGRKCRYCLGPFDARNASQEFCCLGCEEAFADEMLAPPSCAIEAMYPLTIQTMPEHAYLAEAGLCAVGGCAKCQQRIDGKFKGNA